MLPRAVMGYHQSIPIKKFCLARQWWLTPLIPSLEVRKGMEFEVFRSSRSGLHREGEKKMLSCLIVTINWICSNSQLLISIINLIKKIKLGEKYFVNTKKKVSKF